MSIAVLEVSQQKIVLIRVLYHLQIISPSVKSHSHADDVLTGCYAIASVLHQFFISISIAVLHVAKQGTRNSAPYGQFALASAGHCAKKPLSSLTLR